MRIALIAPPFIPVPPVAYGGTELFVAELADGLLDAGHDVTVYANGDSHVRGELRWLYRHAEWPMNDSMASHLKNTEHAAWAIRDAVASVDVLHLNDIVGLPFTRFVDLPAVLTVHHPHEDRLSAIYRRYPDVDYVAISAAQARREPMPKTHIVHHGLAFDRYVFERDKADYLLFLGRMAPVKGAHLAIAAAKRAGMPLKLAGEVQPIFRDYWDQKIVPELDGDAVQYVGEADRVLKNDLLAHARALLFPIQWDEPFGLVMIEAMACGTPVLAFAGGSVEEVVRDGISGWICRDVDDMGRRARELTVAPESCRAWVEAHFSRERMVERYVEIYERALVAVATGDAVGRSSRYR